MFDLEEEVGWLEEHKSNHVPYHLVMDKKMPADHVLPREKKKKKKKKKNCDSFMNKIELNFQ